MRRLSLLALTIVVASIALFPNAASGASRVAGDFNGDGVDDAAVGVPDEDAGVLNTGGVHTIYGVSGAGLDDPGNLFWEQGVNGLAEVRESSDYFGQALAAGDFNGDGLDDLAIGADNEDTAVNDEGVVHVVYAAAGMGLDGAGDQLWQQGANGIDGTGGMNDTFGTSLAAGDLNGDGVDDLAVGVYNEEVNGIAGAGAFHVIYGMAGVGLDSTGTQLWTQDSGAIEDTAELGDHFGDHVAIGDFNGDGFGDVAAGAWGEDVNGDADAGGVGVIFGSAGGLTDTDDQFLTQDSAGIRGNSEPGDKMGEGFAVGDMDADGIDDLAVSAYGDSVGARSGAGGVNMIYGSATGLTGTGDQSWHQNSAGILGVAESGDAFGFTLTAGDFDNDGADDLAIGTPHEDVTGLDASGTLTVIYGVSGSGLDDAGNQGWDQDSPGVKNTREQQDYFAETLSAGDFDGDGIDDIVIGVPHEDIVAAVPIATSHGAIAVLYGTGAGLSGAGDQIAHQDTPGIADNVDQDDHFGETLLGSRTR